MARPGACRTVARPARGRLPSAGSPRRTCPRRRRRPRFRSLANYQPGTFEGWLHRITTNLFLDLVRRRQRIRFDALPEDTERLPGRAPSPEQVYADTHLDPQIQAALDALPPEFRVAVVLCDIEGLTYEEIGATLGIKLGTVRSRIHRGRVQLRQALAHLAPGRAGRATD